LAIISRINLWPLLCLLLILLFFQNTGDLFFVPIGELTAIGGTVFIFSIIALISGIGTTLWLNYGRTTRDIVWIMVLCLLLLGVFLAPFILFLISFDLDSCIIYVIVLLVALILGGFGHSYRMKRKGDWSWQPICYYVGFEMVLSYEFGSFIPYFPIALVLLLWAYSIGYMIHKKYNRRKIVVYGFFGAVTAAYFGPFIYFVPFGYVLVIGVWVLLLGLQFYLKWRKDWRGQNIQWKQMFHEFWRFPIPEPDFDTFHDPNRTLKEKYKSAFSRLWENQFYRPHQHDPENRDDISLFFSCKFYSI